VWLYRLAIKSNPTTTSITKEIAQQKCTNEQILRVMQSLGIDPKRTAEVNYKQMISLIIGK